MKTEFTLHEVLAQLADEGLVKPQENETAVVAPESAETRGSSLPWFVKLFIGISAWIAAILIASFLFIIGIINEDGGAFGFGLILCAAAIGLNRVGRGNTFWVQLSLAASLTGQALAMIGLFALFDDILPVVIVMTVLETILILLHRDSVLRFISTLVVVVLILFLIFEQDAIASIHLFILVLTAGVVCVHLFENHLKLRSLDETLFPVGGAITVSLLGILVLPLSEEFELRWEFTALVLLAILMFLLLRIAAELGYTFRNRAVIALISACLLLLIPSLRMPGILAALIVLALGFWRNARGLIWLAAIFLVFYIWAFYYSMEWTLLVKSLVLLGSGLILLGLRYLLLKFTTKSGEQA